MTRRSVTLHQALHGYENGHRLLGCSTTLTHQAERTLAELSDLSGASEVPGFESYLTGYPLKDAGFYAFARTWYAAERPRPGSVWTHTLLIDFESLGRFPDVAVLVRFFVRPKATDDDLTIYDVPLEVPADLSGGIKATVAGGKAAALIGALYGHSDRPVLIPAITAEEQEEVVLVIWSQQWASLRKAFTFCTGSLSNRTLGNQPFQVQVVPAAALSSIRRLLDGKAVAAHLANGKTVPKHWIRVAVDDVICRGGSQWRHRLSSIAKELPGERRYFPLASTLASWEKAPQNVADARSLVAFLARHIGKKADGREIMSALIDLSLEPERTTLFGVARTFLLEELSVRAEVSEPESGEPALDEKTKRLCSRRPKEAAQLMLRLLKHETNSLGRKLLEGIASGFAARPSAETIAELREALPVLATLNPEIGTMPETWRGPCDRCSDTLDAVIEHGESSTTFRRRVAQAILIAEQHRLARQVVLRIGLDAITTVLEWFNESKTQDPSSLPSAWREVLIAHSDATISWLQQSPHATRLPTIALISTYIDPNWQALKEVDATKWLRAFARDSEDVPPRVRDRASAFLLTVGMGATDPMSRELVVATFEHVHEAVMQSRLDEDAWGWVSSQVPRLGVFRDWDRAERLRRGLIELFATRGWSAVQLAEAASSAESWRYVIKSCRKTRKGKEILRDLARLAAIEGKKLAEEKIRILKELTA